MIGAKNLVRGQPIYSNIPLEMKKGCPPRIGGNEFSHCPACSSGTALGDLRFVDIRVIIECNKKYMHCTKQHRKSSTGVFDTCLSKTCGAVIG